MPNIHLSLLSSILDAREFEWESQLRFYWDREPDELNVRQCTGTFGYGYEYMGLNGRLVITPLTDRIYLTLTQVRICPSSSCLLYLIQCCSCNSLTIKLWLTLVEQLFGAIWVRCLESDENISCVYTFRNFSIKFKVNLLILICNVLADYLVCIPNALTCAIVLHLIFLAVLLLMEISPSRKAYFLWNFLRLSPFVLSIFPVLMSSLQKRKKWPKSLFKY